MEIGILEMTMAGLAPVPVWDKKALGESYFAMRTILDNNFDMIPEGFTGVYFRNEKFQIVPDELVFAIKELSMGGFRHTPEDHTLHLWIDPTTGFGKALAAQIAGLAKEWLDFNMQE